MVFVMDIAGKSVSLLTGAPPISVAPIAAEKTISPDFTAATCAPGTCSRSSSSRTNASIRLTFMPQRPLPRR